MPRQHPTTWAIRRTTTFKIPGCPGWYKWDGYDLKVEVYAAPNGEMAVWCEDIGVSDYCQMTDGDDMNGHMLCMHLGGVWCQTECDR